MPSSQLLLPDSFLHVLSEVTVSLMAADAESSRSGLIFSGQEPGES